MDLDTMKKHMNNYIDEDDDRDFIIGNETVELMAKSALNTLQAVREIQKYAEKEGYWKET